MCLHSTVGAISSACDVQKDLIVQTAYVEVATSRSSNMYVELTTCFQHFVVYLLVHKLAIVVLVDDKNRSQILLFINESIYTLKQQQ